MGESRYSRELRRRQTVTDPNELFNLWRRSDYYREKREGFFLGGVTEEEKQRAFEDSYEAKVSLLDMCETEVEFRYESGQYSRRVNKAVDEYVESAEDLRKMVREGGGEEIRFADGERSKCHNELAKALEREGLVPNKKIGRTFGRLILISKGLDFFDDARRSDYERAVALL